VAEPAPLPEGIEPIAAAIVDAAFKIHQALGPGLLESVYEACLAHELGKRQIPVQRQVPIPVIYDGLRLETGFRVDLLVSDLVIVEVKSVERDASVHLAQIMTYLRLSGRRLGFLINFNVPMIRTGIRRIVL
jgi:GxxExxY protein